MKYSIHVLIIVVVLLSSIPLQAADLYVFNLFDLKPETGVSEQTAQTLTIASDYILNVTTYIDQQKRKRKAVLMSLFLPGSGQLKSHQTVRGIVYMAAFVGTAYMSYDNLGKFNDAQSEYDAASEIYNAPFAQSQPIIDEAFNRMQTAQWDMTDYDIAHQQFLLTSGLIWAWNVIDAMIWGGGKAETHAFNDSPIQIVALPNRVTVAIQF